MILHPLNLLVHNDIMALSEKLVPLLVRSFSSFFFCLPTVRLACTM